MAIHLTPYDSHMLERYLDMMIGAARSSRDTRAVRSSLNDLIGMIAADDAEFRRHLKDAITEHQDA